MRTLVIGGMHGNEPLGLELVNLLRVDAVQGIETCIANPLAASSEVRFIAEDLNRVFPGTKNGSYESRRARLILAKTKPYDIVLDFHNTQADQPSSGFVGLQYDERLLGVATALGIRYIIEASYDCINKYAPNCLSVEICLRDSNASRWFEKLKRPLVGNNSKPKMYRYLRRITWEESEGLGRDRWRAFRELPMNDKRRLGINGSACPIFIGSRFTAFYATLVSRVDNLSGTMMAKD